MRIDQTNRLAVFLCEYLAGIESYSRLKFCLPEKKFTKIKQIDIHLLIFEECSIILSNPLISTFQC